MSSTGPNPFGANPFGTDTSGSSADRTDPAAAFATAMRDLWGFGAAMLQSAAPGRPGVEDPFAAAAAPAAAMLRAYADAVAPFAGGRSDPPGMAQDAARQALDVAPALAQAGSIALGSALRYGQGLAEVMARHQAILATATAARMMEQAGTTTARPEAAAEQLRAFLRDVSETAMLEARRLEHELAALGEAVAQGVAPTAGPDAPYRRRQAVKP
jgi:hypothetical protein